MAVQQNNGDGDPFAVMSERLAPFLEKHPSSQLQKSTRKPPTAPLAIAQPWNDPSLKIIIPDDPNSLVAALNNVLLPEAFSAIWHRDTNDFEIIYTAFPLPKDSEDAIEARVFTFNYEGEHYRCEFGPSSDRLLEIARHARPISASNTDHRNLLSYWLYTEHLRV